MSGETTPASTSLFAYNTEQLSAAQKQAERLSNFRKELANSLADHHAAEVLLFFKIVENCKFFWYDIETASCTELQSKPRNWGQYLFNQFTTVVNEPPAQNCILTANEAPQRIATFQLPQDASLPERPNFIPLFRFAMYGVERFSLEFHAKEKSMGDQYNSYAAKEKNLLLEEILIQEGLLDPSERTEYTEMDCADMEDAVKYTLHPT